jgi:hypothetical protein
MMATKKKTPKKKVASGKKKSSSRKITPRQKSRRAAANTRKVSVKATAAKSGAAKSTPKIKPPQRSAVRTAPQQKAGKATQSASRRGSARPENVRVVSSSIPTRGEGQSVETINLDVEGLDPRSGGQSGDLQGLSDVAGSDMESVDELLEEGNAFEAEVVKGIQDTPDADEAEIHTHERPGDDNLDEDQREN